MGNRKGFGILNSIFNSRPSSTNPITSQTVGIVVDTNDPLQAGRIRVACSALNDNIDFDSETYNIEKIPWSSYCSPLAGTSVGNARGPEGDRSIGSTAYGMWGIPKRGSQVVIMCLDGDPNIRVWVGCFYGEEQTHTIPGGRYITAEDSNVGPLTGADHPIEPIYSNQTKAFKNRSGFEWQTRGADYQASANNFPFNTEATNTDTTNGEIYGHNIKQGYGTDTAINYSDSNANQVFSWTTPGTHAIIMDDRAENCRMKFRTTTGHQIILDDTNERIYISTNRGNSWIEMDSNGNIDVYADRYLNFHSKKDMNFTSDKSIRFKAKEGLHFVSNKDIRMECENVLSLKSNNNINVTSQKEVFIKATTNVNIDGDTMVGLNSLAGTVSLLAPTVGLTGLSVLLSGGLGFNAGTAPPPTIVLPNYDPLFAFSTSRVPFKFDTTGDKTWSRGMLDPNKTDSASSNLSVDYTDYANFELGYDESGVGEIELGDTITRGTHWRR